MASFSQQEREGFRRVRRRASTGAAMARDAGSGAGRAAGSDGVALGLVLERPKLLRTSERSVRSMVGALSKLPLVHWAVVAPKLFKTVERSVRSTWPSALVSP